MFPAKILLHLTIASWKYTCSKRFHLLRKTESGVQTVVKITAQFMSCDKCVYTTQSNLFTNIIWLSTAVTDYLSVLWVSANWKASEMECGGLSMLRYPVKITTLICHQQNGSIDKVMVMSRSQLIVCFWALDKLLILKSYCQSLFPQPSCQEPFVIVFKLVHLWMCLPSCLDDEISGLSVTWVRLLENSLTLLSVK